MKRLYVVIWTEEDVVMWKGMIVCSCIWNQDVVLRKEMVICSYMKEERCSYVKRNDYM
jgi:hypothetical protein